MQTIISEPKRSKIPARLSSPSEKTDSHGAPGKLASTAPAFVGLTHLIHQINNPIQLVYGATGLMEHELCKLDCADSRFLSQVFQTLKGGVDQLVTLVSALRGQMDCLWRMEAPFVSVNVNLILHEILKAEAAAFAAGAIRIRKYLTANLPPIEGNEKLLKQAFVNVLKNAAEAMPEGGILSVRTGVSERGVFIEIADTGPGIAPDLDIFQPFATSKAGAMGLGLPIARHIVEAHDGSLVCKSQPAMGATLCFHFPWAPDVKEVSA
jgi:two-component system NtrC family sensor kinase